MLGTRLRGLADYMSDTVKHWFSVTDIIYVSSKESKSLHTSSKSFCISLLIVCSISSLAV